MLRTAGIVIVLVGLFWVGSWATLKFLPQVLIPTASLTTTQQPSPTSTFISPPPTKTLTPKPTYTKTQTPTPLPTMITDVKGFSMVPVPAGEFMMGSNAEDALAECKKYSTRTDCQLDWFKNEEPPHQVYLDAYYMDIYEVTNTAYKVCVNAGICDPPQYISRYDDPWYKGHPVTVNWIQASAYCAWRGASLPTEAQWEKAARGTDGRTYPWGEGIDCSKANYFNNGSFCAGSAPSKVGSYESGNSPYGIYDMAGNVWEWVADWYSDTYYQNSPSENPLGPDSGQYRVLRGGSYLDEGDVSRVYIRYWYTPDSSVENVGFRCAKDVIP